MGCQYPLRDPVPSGVVSKVPEKHITAFGQSLVMACDGKCFKAWGINTRPRTYVENDPDADVHVFTYKSDSELERAPVDPGTYEGGHGKPCNRQLGPQSGHYMNKWCFRECERSVSYRPDESKPLPDFDNPKPLRERVFW